LLRQGDWLRVTPRDETKVSVLGEVVRPSMVTTRNGRLSLNEALAEAGGLVPISASPRQIFVVRRDGERIRAFHLDAQSPAMLALADRFELQARDIVYVDAAPLALWNRTVALLIPTLGALQTTNTLLNNR
jgi:polysaccharide export outer membrane protein